MILQNTRTSEDVAIPPQLTSYAKSKNYANAKTTN